MKIYKIAYQVDDFLLKSLNEWLFRVIPQEETDMAREKMLMWLQSEEDIDTKHALDSGWRKVYDLAMEKYYEDI